MAFRNGEDSIVLCPLQTPQTCQTLLILCRLDSGRPWKGDRGRQRTEGPEKRRHRKTLYLVLEGLRRGEDQTRHDHQRGEGARGAHAGVVLIPDKAGPLKLGM